MNLVATAERERAKAAPESAESLFRLAKGNRLLAMFKKLEELDRKFKGVIIPTDKDRAASPRFVIVKGKELRHQARHLRKAELGDENFYENLTAKIPKLAKPKNIVIDHTDITPSGRGHHLSIGFDEDSTQALDEERCEVLTALEEMADVPDDGGLDWHLYNPDMLAMFVRSSVPKKESAIETVANYIQAHLPMKIVLEPIYNPVDQV